MNATRTPKAKKRFGSPGEERVKSVRKGFEIVTRGHWQYLTPCMCEAILAKEIISQMLQDMETHVVASTETYARLFLELKKELVDTLP